MHPAVNQEWAADRRLNEVSHNGQDTESRRTAPLPLMLQAYSVPSTRPGLRSRQDRVGLLPSPGARDPPMGSALSSEGSDMLPYGVSLQVPVCGPAQGQPVFSSS